MKKNKLPKWMLDIMEEERNKPIDPELAKWQEEELRKFDEFNKTPQGKRAEFIGRMSAYYDDISDLYGKVASAIERDQFEEADVYKAEIAMIENLILELRGEYAAYLIFGTSKVSKKEV